jgi:LacI family transcriptional regulator
MTVTLKQVAMKTGVSHQTVWRALQGSSSVLPSTRAHVLEVAAQLGYRRNRLAGSLRTSQSATLGLVVLDVSNPHTGALTAGLVEAAGELGYTVLLMNSYDSVVQERAAVGSLMERRVDGLIINPARGGDHSYLRKDLPAGFPLVAINRPVLGLECPTVQSRHQDVAEAAKHLIREGHARIGGIFGPFENVPFRMRCQVLQRTLRAKNLSARPEWLRSGENTVAFGREALHEILRGKHAPTAIFVASHRLTEGALLGLRDVGKRWATDFGLVGFDLHYGGFLSPPLPTLIQPAQEMGRLAVKTLLALIGGARITKLAPLPLRLALDHGDFPEPFDVTHLSAGPGGNPP